MNYKEKAKAYDEALKKSKKLYEQGTITESLSYVFPELKESDDEKIRKEIIEYFKKYPALSLGDYNVQDILAWLEKQGEQKHAKNIVETWKAMRLEVYQQASGNRHEPNCSDDTTKMFSLNDIDEIVEKMSEQSSADNVEPKFKVGDWVVFNNKHQSIYQVEKIEDGYYILRHKHGGTFRVCVLHDESLRLWTIKDAKAGDVLCDIANKNVLIFNEISDGWVKCLCSVHLNNSCCLNCTELYGREEQCSFTPATKEQRDLLFQKMREAGCEWDTEKKELKKVENEIEVPFGVKDSELKEEIYYIPKGFYAEIDDDKVVIKKGEKPTAWSEEDKNFMYDTLSNLTELKDRYGEGYGNVGKCIEWLKSLKPQNRWKPSDEQIIELHRVISGCSYDIEPLVEIEEHLKKLREE